MDFLEAHARSGRLKRVTNRCAESSESPRKYRGYCKETWREACKRTKRLMERYRRRSSSSKRTVDVLAGERRTREEGNVTSGRRRVLRTSINVRFEDVRGKAIHVMKCPTDQGLADRIDEYTTTRILLYLDVRSLARLSVASKRTLLISGENELWKARCTSRSELSAFEGNASRVKNWRLEYRWRTLKRRQIDLWRYNYSQGRVGRMRQIVRPREDGHGYNMNDDQKEVLYACNFLKENHSGISGELGRAIEPSQGVGVVIN